jgi:Tfp pilus assembly protein PilX
MTRRLHLAAEQGFSMLVVIMVMLATSILAGAAFAAVGSDIPFARASQDRKQAYAAAEAGIEYYLYQLARDNDYWTHCTAVEAPGDGQPSPINDINPGLTRTWRNVSGTDARFSIELLPANGAAKCDKTKAEETMLDMSSGSFRIRSTGESRGVRRSIVSTLRRTSFLDYLYFTDYEMSDPLSFPIADQANVTNCVRYRAQRNAIPWCADPNNRINITFPTWDVINGPLHTNDDLLTCGSPNFGRNDPTKTDRIEISGPAPNGYTVNGTCGGIPDFYGPVRLLAQKLPIPPSNTRLRDAADIAYIFSGQTTIDFNNGSMDVTSYDKTSGALITKTDMALPENGVIYVDKVGSCSIDPPRQLDYVPSDGWGCAILTVHGTYAKSMTLGSADDILIDGDLKALDMPEPGPVLGLIAQRFVRVKHDVPGTCGANSGALTDVTVEAAILALKDSFVVDNYPCGGPLGTLTVTGAIAQKFRGAVGTFDSSTGPRVSGYAKNYTYDDRLRYRSPPDFLDPITAAWRVVRNNEQVSAAK